MYENINVFKIKFLTSPQYSEMNSFFCTGSLMKIPQPATSEGASSKCWQNQKSKCFKQMSRTKNIHPNQLHTMQLHTKRLKKKDRGNQ